MAEENNEKKVVKKTATKKKTTSTKKDKNITLADIPQELISQIVAQALAVSNIKNEEVSKSEESPEHYTKSFLSRNEEIKKEDIAVRSVVKGVVTFKSNTTNMTWKWVEKGSIQYLPISEILVMDSKPKFLHSPLLIVEDERVIEALGLKDLYSNINEIENLEEFLENDIEHITKVIEKLSYDYKQNLIAELNNGIKNKTLKSDYFIIEALEELLNVKFDK